jgi:predicted nuclease with TOPRIM domain
MFPQNLVIKMLTTLALLGVLVLAYRWHRTSLFELGYSKAMTEIQEAQNEKLRERNKEISRLLKANHDIQTTYDKFSQSLKASVARLSEHERWLRNENANLNRRLKAANPDAVLAYAEAVTRNNERLRGDVVRFGSEAAECSAVAHALKASSDASVGVTANVKSE